MAQRTVLHAASSVFMGSGLSLRSPRNDKRGGLILTSAATRIRPSRFDEGAGETFRTRLRARIIPAAKHGFDEAGLGGAVLIHGLAVPRPLQPIVRLPQSRIPAQVLQEGVEKVVLAAQDGQLNGKDRKSVV